MVHIYLYLALFSRLLLSIPLGQVGTGIKDRVTVRYINEFGEDEMGIDSGGLFKDFVTDVAARVFNPSYVRLSSVNEFD